MEDQEKKTETTEEIKKEEPKAEETKTEKKAETEEKKDVKEKKDGWFKRQWKKGTRFVKKHRGAIFGFTSGAAIGVGSVIAADYIGKKHHDQMTNQPVVPDTYSVSDDDSLNPNVYE